MTDVVIVVGAGISGLTAAAAIATTGASVVVVERLPAVGGVWGFDNSVVVEAELECRNLGVEFQLGCSAIRWKDHRLLIIGPGQVRWLEAHRLIFTGGSRPPTPAELGVTGGRLAGVFAVTVAHHLLDAGVVLGRNSVVIGSADDAAIVLPHLTKHGHVSVVGEAPSKGGGRFAESVDWWPKYRPLHVRGTDRVDRIRIGDGSVETELYCDAVIFAGDPRPFRNIDGAVREGSPDVTFIQPLDAGLGVAAVQEVVRTSLTSSRS